MRGKVGGARRGAERDIGEELLPHDPAQRATGLGFETGGVERGGDPLGALGQSRLQFADIGRQIAEVPDRARLHHRRALSGNAAEDALQADNRTDILLVAETVLKADGDGVRTKQSGTGAYRLDRVHRLGLDNDHVHRA